MVNVFYCLCGDLFGGGFTGKGKLDVWVVRAAVT